MQPTKPGRAAGGEPPIVAPANAKSGPVHLDADGVGPDRSSVRVQPVVRYCCRMLLNRPFALRVLLTEEGKRATGGWKGSMPVLSGPTLTIAPVVPGANVSPPSMDVAAVPGSEARFTVVPLCRGKLRDARVELRAGVRSLGAIPLRMKACTRRLTWFLFFLAILLPGLLALLKVSHWSPQIVVPEKHPNPRVWLRAHGLDPDKDKVIPNHLINPPTRGTGANAPATPNPVPRDPEALPLRQPAPPKDEGKPKDGDAKPADADQPKDKPKDGGKPKDGDAKPADVDQPKDKPKDEARRNSRSNLSQIVWQEPGKADEKPQPPAKPGGGRQGGGRPGGGGPGGGGPGGGGRPGGGGGPMALPPPPPIEQQVPNVLVTYDGERAIDKYMARQAKTVRERWDAPNWMDTMNIADFGVLGVITIYELKPPAGVARAVVGWAAKASGEEMSDQEIQEKTDEYSKTSFVLFGYRLLELMRLTPLADVALCAVLLLFTAVAWVLTGPASATKRGNVVELPA